MNAIITDEQEIQGILNELITKIECDTSGFSMGQSIPSYSLPRPIQRRVARPQRQIQRQNHRYSSVKRKLEFEDDDISHLINPTLYPLLIPCSFPGLEMRLRLTKPYSWLRIGILRWYQRVKFVQPTKESIEFENKLGFTIPNPFQAEIDFLDKYIKQEKQIRWAFKKLLNRWLYKKYSSRLFNTTDLITCEEPIKPLFIFSVQQRGSYVFELRSAKILLETALKSSEYVRATPQKAKNPYTNIEFSLQEELHLINTLRFFGESSWLLEGYKSTRYSLPKFLSNFSAALHCEIIKDFCRNPQLEDSQEHFIEFLDYVSYYCDDATATYKMRTLIWAAKRKTTDSFIKKWRKIYSEYYHIHYQFPVVPPDDILYDSIYRTATRLFLSSQDFKRLTELRLLSSN